MRCSSKCSEYIVFTMIPGTHSSKSSDDGKPDPVVTIDAPVVPGTFVKDFNQAVKKGVPLLVPVATLWTSFERLQEVKWSEGLILSVLPALYGAPHLIGWFAVFPTTWERIAWRLSSLVVMGSGLTAFVLFGATALAQRPWVQNIIKKYYDHKARPYGSLPIADEMPAGLLPYDSPEGIPIFNGTANRTIWVLVLVPYAAASTFLLAESFRQLFALPPGVFELPSWTESFPHFG